MSGNFTESVAVWSSYAEVIVERRLSDAMAPLNFEFPPMRWRSPDAS